MDGIFFLIGPFAKGLEVPAYLEATLTIVSFCHSTIFD